MSDVIGRARASRGALERLGARVPGFSGYLERELRREADQRLRAELALHLDRARDAVLRHVARLDPAAPTVARLADAERGLDLLANRVRHAGAGYAGAFDAVKVGEAELDALYAFDEALLGRVDAVVAATSGLASDAGAALPELEAAVAALGAEVDRRDDVVRSVFAAKR